MIDNAMGTVRERFTNKLQDHNKLKSQDLFRLGGHRWRRMSSAEKMPYVEAANLVKQQTQPNGKNERQNKSVGGDSSKKPDNQKDQKKKDQVHSLNKLLMLIPIRFSGYN